eukprot:gene6065-11437_t
MSSAFDAIKRHDLIDVLQTFLNEGECRMTRLLLSNTTINIQLGNNKNNDIGTNVGSTQGDAISAEFDLKVNEEKTEETTITRRRDKKEEEWRRTKKLGSLLGCQKDMKRRIQ